MTLRVEIKPPRPEDVEPARHLEEHTNWILDQIRRAHREGQHTYSMRLCPICQGMEEP